MAEILEGIAKDYNLSYKYDWKKREYVFRSNGRHGPLTFENKKTITHKLLTALNMHCRFENC